MGDRHFSFLSFSDQIEVYGEGNLNPKRQRTSSYQVPDENSNPIFHEAHDLLSRNERLKAHEQFHRVSSLFNFMEKYMVPRNQPGYTHQIHYIQMGNVFFYVVPKNKLQELWLWIDRHAEEFNDLDTWTYVYFHEIARSISPVFFELDPKHEIDLEAALNEIYKEFFRGKEAGFRVLRRAANGITRYHVYVTQGYEIDDYAWVMNRHHVYHKLIENKERFEHFGIDVNAIKNGRLRYWQSAKFDIERPCDFEWQKSTRYRESLFYRAAGDGVQLYPEYVRHVVRDCARYYSILTPREETTNKMPWEDWDSFHAALTEIGIEVPRLLAVRSSNLTFDWRPRKHLRAHLEGFKANPEAEPRNLIQEMKEIRDFDRLTEFYREVISPEIRKYCCRLGDRLIALTATGRYSYQNNEINFTAMEEK